MKLFPYLLQFLSGNSKDETVVAITREVPKTQRHAVRLLLIEVQSPSHQQHIVAIPPCASCECLEPRIPNLPY